jgi:hypothetical protein
MYSVSQKLCGGNWPEEIRNSLKLSGGVRSKMCDRVTIHKLSRGRCSNLGPSAWAEDEEFFLTS